MSVIIDDIIYNIQTTYKLDLSNKKLQKIPNEVFRLIYLTHLDISNNNIIEIPEDINKLFCLEELNVSNNKIIFLPQALIALKYMKTFKFNNNFIEFAPLNVTRWILNKFRSDHCEIQNIKFANILKKLYDIDTRKFNCKFLNDTEIFCKHGEIIDKNFLCTLLHDDTLYFGDILFIELYKQIMCYVEQQNKFLRKIFKMKMRLFEYEYKRNLSEYGYDTYYNSPVYFLLKHFSNFVIDENENEYYKHLQIFRID